MSNQTFQVNTDIWENIYSKNLAGAHLKYPCEDFIVTVSRHLLKNDVDSRKVLDVGCGSGNNLEFLSEVGFECYGLDVSASALEISRERLRQKGLGATLKQLREDRIYPFQNDFLDVVIAWHVLSYNDEECLMRVMKEIKRVLKPGGVLLATFPTFKEYRLVQSKQITKNTFEFVAEGSNQKGVIVIGAEKEEDVREIFNEFSDLDIGYSEISIRGITNSHWLVVGKN